MPFAEYHFRTSSFHWRMGVVFLAAAGTTVGLRFYLQGPSPVPFWLAGAFLFFSLLCFLGRFNLQINANAGTVRESRGFWPFAQQSVRGVSDFAGLEITYMRGSKSGNYTLWLVAVDGRRISLAVSDAWPGLHDRALELSSVTGWPVSDQTNGRNSLVGIMGS